MKIFIPIKEKSVRVPRKNFKLLGDKPLYLHTLEKLRGHEVLVDTDSDEVVRNCYGLPHVVAYKRNKNLIGNDVSVSLLIQNCVKEFLIKDEVMCQMHVTSPFLEPTTIENAARMIVGSGVVDSVSSVNSHKARFWADHSASGHVPWPENVVPVNHNPLELKKTQDLYPILEENSLFYLFKPSIISKTGNRISSRHKFYETRKLESIDIDTMEDWQMVELLYKGLNA